MLYAARITECVKKFSPEMDPRVGSPEKGSRPGPRSTWCWLFVVTGWVGGLGFGVWGLALGGLGLGGVGLGDWS